MFENQKFTFLLVVSLVVVIIYQSKIILEKNSSCKQPLEIETQSSKSESTVVKSFDEDYKDLQAKWVREFAEIGRKHGTDKVSVHHYQNVYGKYLGK